MAPNPNLIGPEHVDGQADGTLYRQEEIYVPTTGGPVLRVNAGFVAPGQTVKNYTGKIATSATVATTVTLETVTAGKTYFMTDLFWGYDDNVAHDTRMQAAGVDIFRWAVKGDTAPLQASGMETQPNASAGQVVTILLPVCTGAPNFYFYVGGIES